MKKSLSQAIALAALVGGAATAQAAVQVNHEGIGGALLYPIYTVENGNTTLLNVVNTTDKYKAVKVRFVEAKNSAEVLDFHLYMSPQDVWSGQIVPTAGGAKLVSNDRSCIAGVTDNKGNFPAAGLEFSTAQIVKDGDNVELTGAHADRVRVGHFEVIEMAEVTEAALQKGILHSKGIPANCDVVTNKWKTGSWDMAGVANDRVSQDDGLSAPTGGLYGTAAVVNVPAGWAASYDAVALVDTDADGSAFYSDIQHPRPGSIYPHLATVLADGETTPDDDRLDDVTAALQLSSIYNDYFVDAAYGAETDLVVTFPTKRFYTFTATDLDTTSRKYKYAGGTGPFDSLWNGNNKNAANTGKAPVNFKSPIVYDKDEQSEEIDDLFVSPRPLVAGTLPLNYETNVISINGSDTFGTKGLVRTQLDVSYLEGWIDISRAKGVPAIGFANIVTKNGVQDGSLRNFAQTFKHKTVAK